MSESITQTQTLVTECSSGQIISWGNEFNCYQMNSNNTLLLINYPTINSTYQRLQNAILSGAHIITSNYPTLGMGQIDGYYLKINNSTSRVNCNPITTNNELDIHSILCKSDVINQQYFHIQSNFSNTLMLVSIIGGCALALILFIVYQYCKNSVKNDDSNKEDIIIEEEDFLEIEKQTCLIGFYKCMAATCCCQCCDKNNHNKIKKIQSADYLPVTYDSIITQERTY